MDPAAAEEKCRRHAWSQVGSNRLLEYQGSCKHAVRSLKTLLGRSPPTPVFKKVPGLTLAIWSPAACTACVAPKDSLPECSPRTMLVHGLQLSHTKNTKMKSLIDFCSNRPLLLTKPTMKPRYFTTAMPKKSCPTTRMTRPSRKCALSFAPSMIRHCR